MHSDFVINKDTFTLCIKINGYTTHVPPSVVKQKTVFWKMLDDDVCSFTTHDAPVIFILCPLTGIAKKMWQAMTFWSSQPCQVNAVIVILHTIMIFLDSCLLFCL